MTIRVLDDALVDIDEAARWYDDKDPGLGDEFMAELNTRLAALLAQPEVWPLWPGLRPRKFPIRKRQLSRFPYSIAYQLIDNTIVVVAVAAHRKRPNYWEDRVK